jgi:non-ribosomal peptide synthetase component E (peptide arylation enzyme)
VHNPQLNPWPKQTRARSQGATLKTLRISQCRIGAADHTTSRPKIDIPRDYNAAHDLIERNLQAGRGDKPAFIDDLGTYTYSDVASRSSAFSNVLRDLGIEMEQRILLCLHDTIDFPTVFLGAIKAGAVPIPVNTLLPQATTEYMLSDNRARIAVVFRCCRCFNHYSASCRSSKGFLFREVQVRRSPSR